MLKEETRIDSYYEDLSDEAKAIIPQLEKLLNGLSMHEVIKVYSCVKQKMMKETKANLIAKV